MIQDDQYYDQLKFTGFKGVLLVGSGRTIANTRKEATQFKSMIDNEPISPTKTNSATMEKILMSRLISLQETINKQGEEIRTLMTENTKLQIVVIEN